MKTEEEAYTRRLVDKTTWWKRLLDVQRPYRNHLRGLRLGRVLDLGCGIGRNLAHLEPESMSVGVDHNPHSVLLAVRRGLAAFTPEEFRISAHAVPGAYDTLLYSHVAEHQRFDDNIALLGEYLGYLKPWARVLVITPQEAGYRSDATHVEFVDLPSAARLLLALGIAVERQYSFPLPAWVGRVFRHNEFVTIGRKGA